MYVTDEGIETAAILFSLNARFSIRVTPFGIDTETSSFFSKAKLAIFTTLAPSIVLGISRATGQVPSERDPGLLGLIGLITSLP